MKFETDVAALPGSLTSGYNFLVGGWSESDLMFRTAKRLPPPPEAFTE